MHGLFNWLITRNYSWSEEKMSAVTETMLERCPASFLLHFIANPHALHRHSYLTGLSKPRNKDVMQTPNKYRARRELEMVMLWAVHKIRPDSRVYMMSKAGFRAICAHLDIHLLWEPVGPIHRSTGEPGMEMPIAANDPPWEAWWARHGVPYEDQLVREVRAIPARELSKVRTRPVKEAKALSLRSEMTHAQRKRHDKAEKKALEEYQESFDQRQGAELGWFRSFVTWLTVW